MKKNQLLGPARVLVVVDQPLVELVVLTLGHGKYITRIAGEPYAPERRAPLGAHGREHPQPSEYGCCASLPRIGQSNTRASSFAGSADVTGT